MNYSEFIDSLTFEEMRHVLYNLADCYCSDCPVTQDNAFNFCDEDVDYCSQEPDAMCWIRFYVWQFRKRQAERKAGGDKQ